MKITFLTPNLEMHGGNLVMLKYANYLAGKGNDITIISSDKITLSDINPVIQVKTYKSFPIRYVDFFLLQKIYFSKIIDLIEECDFIIPIYTPLLPAVLKAKITKGLSAKVILLFQDSFAMIWAGGLIKKILSDRKVCKNIDGAICIGKSTESALKSVCKVNTEVITSGIDLELFYDRGLPKEKYILFVGRPQAPKGFPYFKEAINTVVRSHPDFHAKVIAPTVEDQTIGNIEYIKYRDREQLAKIYNQARVYVSASLSESFGLPPLEAMASNTAVVMTDTVGSKEYARDKSNCFVVPTKNSKKLAEAINSLLDDKRMAQNLQKEALKDAKRYDWNKSFEQFERYLEDKMSVN